MNAYAALLNGRLRMLISRFDYQCAVIAVFATISAVTFSSATQAADERPSLVGVDAVIEGVSRQTESVIGQLVATRRGTVASRLAGVVTSLNVRIGDRVEKDGLLAEIDIDTVRAEREVAARQRDQAIAAEEAREAELGLARQDRERFEKLKESASVSASRFDDAVQNEIIIAARLREARASRAAAESNLVLAELDLQHGQIKAPFAGYIVEKSTELGSYLSVGSPIVEIIGDKTFEIEVDIPFDRLNELAHGSEITATLNGQDDAGSTIHASVRAILPDENPRTRTRRVRLTPTSTIPTAGLADGQSVDVAVPIAASRSILSVHKDAIIRRGEKVIVYVVEDSTAKIRPVTLGLSIGNRFEVKQGLDIGEQVVVRGNERLRPDAPIKVVGSKSSESEQRMSIDKTTSEAVSNPKSDKPKQ